jgi:CRISPR/Cas system CSM-associated protein Csm2 small subunit
LRKFFDEILNCKIQQQEKNNNKKNQHGNALDLSIQIKIKMMASKVAYAYGRNNIGDKYKNVFLQGIKKIYTSDDLVYFSDFLECFTGYYRELRPKEK